MKYLNGKYYVEVKDKRYIIHPTETTELGLRKNQNFSELNTKFKMIFNLEEIKKILGIILMK